MSTLPKIIAVDFDGTLFENAWPDVGAPIEKNINKLKAEQADGAKVILWTNRVGGALDKAVNMAFIWTPSMKICLRSYRDLELTAVRSLPMSIGTIMRSGCLSKTLGSSLTASTHSILSIISGLSSSPRS